MDEEMPDWLVVENDSPNPNPAELRSLHAMYERTMASLGEEVLVYWDRGSVTARMARDPKPEPTKQRSCT